MESLYEESLIGVGVVRLLGLTFRPKRSMQWPVVRVFEYPRVQPRAVGCAL